MWVMWVRPGRHAKIINASYWGGSERMSRSWSKIISTVCVPPINALPRLGSDWEIAKNGNPGALQPQWHYWSWDAHKYGTFRRDAI